MKQEPSGGEVTIEMWLVESPGAIPTHAPQTVRMGWVGGKLVNLDPIAFDFMGAFDLMGAPGSGPLGRVE